MDERERLVGWAKKLAWLGVGWHGVEAAIAVGAWVVAGSIALVGFGADSLIETLAGFVLLWRFGGARTSSEAAEKRAQKLIGLWWADPVTALLIAGVAVKEGRESWRGESCCAAPVANCEDDCCG